MWVIYSSSSSSPKDKRFLEGPVGFFITLFDSSSSPSSSSSSSTFFLFLSSDKDEEEEVELPAVVFLTVLSEVFAESFDLLCVGFLNLYFPGVRSFKSVMKTKNRIHYYHYSSTSTSGDWVDKVHEFKCLLYSFSSLSSCRVNHLPASFWASSASSAVKSPCFNTTTVGFSSLASSSSSESSCTCSCCVQDRWEGERDTF